jgi:hypothetical protein
MQDSIGAKIVPEEEDMQAPKGKKIQRRPNEPHSGMQKSSQKIV